MPVDAGSIPYSAVSQPRPEPSRHDGTLSTSEAVQITRVPPIAISADPSRAAHEAGLDLDRPQLVGRAPVGAAGLWSLAAARRILANGALDGKPGGCSQPRLRPAFQ